MSRAKTDLGQAVEQPVSASGGLLRATLSWTCVLLLGLALLSGRYHWGVDVASFSMRGYLSSAYMFVLFLPTLYYTLRAFALPARRTQMMVAAVALLLTMPYVWLGLDGAYLLIGQPHRYGFAMTAETRPVAPEWFPAALARLPAIPYEGLVFTGLLLAGLLVALLAWRRLDDPARRRALVLVLGAYGLILLQAWLHLSLRSPYVYLTYFEQPADQNYWYLVYLFPGGRGAVNADNFVFRALEEHFQGAPYDVNTMLIRRSFPFYLSAQLTYWINPFYVFLVLNVALWLVAVLCLYLFARDLWGERVALFAAVLLASGSGFIVYVAQPMVYVAGIALIVVLCYLFHRLIVRGQRRPADYLLFGLLLGLGTLTYDIFQVYLFLALYALIQRVPLRGLALAFAVAVALYLGFLYLQTDILQLRLEQKNSQETRIPGQNILAALRDHNPNEWYFLSASFADRYLGHLSRAFFVLPLLLAMVGFVLAQPWRLRLILLAMLLPSVAAAAYLHFGQFYLAAMPRFVYMAYPAVYILAAITLDRLASLDGQPRWAWVGRYGPWLLVALVVMLNNADVFGLPATYYHFYHQQGGYYLDGLEPRRTSP
jgi:hypothetical protein